MILDLPGSAGQTKIPTDCCANICRVAPICPCTVRPSSVPSQGSSMKGRERPCSIRRRLRSSLNVLQRSVELAARSGHSGVIRRNIGIPAQTVIRGHVHVCPREAEASVKEFYKMIKFGVFPYIALLVWRRRSSLGRIRIGSCDLCIFSARFTFPSSSRHPRPSFYRYKRSGSRGRSPTCP